MSAVDLASLLYLLLAAQGLSLAVVRADLPVLGHGAFLAVGGFGTLLLGPGHAGLPLGLAAALATAAAGVLGWLVGFGGARLRGPYLALATWALAWWVQAVLLAFPGFSGGVQGVTAPSPARLVSPSTGLDLTLTPGVHVGVAAALCVLAALAARRLESGPGGLDLAALRGGPDLAGVLGVPVAARRRAVLAVAATAGGLSGAGTAVLLGLVAPADVGPRLGLELVVAVLAGAAVVGAHRVVLGPLVGVALLAALPVVADALAGPLATTGERSRGALTALLLAVVLGLRVLRRRPDVPAGPSTPAPAAPGAADRTAPRRRGPVLLRTRNLHGGYGGAPVVAGVTLSLRAGEVHALVGPNGSGKTTLLRLLSGALGPSAGSVVVAGRPVGHEGSPGRVRAGVARTPQRTLSLGGLDVAGQVSVGARGGAPRPLAVLRHLLGTPSSRTEAARREATVARVLAETGLAHLAHADPGTLATGDARLLQVARAVAADAPVLLLDEPAAGTTPAERDALAALLPRLARNGRAVLLVEHDMRLVAQVADRVTVLADGSVLAQGTPEEIRADPSVRAAYLGRGARP